MRHGPSLLAGFTAALFSLFLLPAPVVAQKYTSYDRALAEDMLRNVEHDLKSNYYDPKFHGYDVDERFRLAAEKIKAAASFNYALSDIAGALDALDDSHTLFLPPSRPYTHDFGLHFQMIGPNDCFVTAVRPKSDAEAKGLCLGDQILSIDGYRPFRDDLWKMKYVYNLLRPQAGLRLVVRSPGGSPRQLDAMAKMTMGKRVVNLTGQDIWDVVREVENDYRLSRSRYHEMDGVLVWKLPDFVHSRESMDPMLGRARKGRAVILDLRGNPGGSVDLLEEMVGGFFDHDVKIADRVGRKNMKPEIAKTMRKNAFTGKLVVLVDSDTGSAAELFARVCQLERRCTVVGDRSSGRVMEARIFSRSLGMETVVFYGAEITVADLVMADGKSLEKTGVTPDELVLPTGADLAAGRDPALARAAQLVGLSLTPEQAGKLFPVEWPPD